MSSIYSSSCYICDFEVNFKRVCAAEPYQRYCSFAAQAYQQQGIVSQYSEIYVVDKHRIVYVIFVLYFFNVNVNVNKPKVIDSSGYRTGSRRVII